MATIDYAARKEARSGSKTTPFESDSKYFIDDVVDLNEFIESTLPEPKLREINQSTANNANNTTSNNNQNLIESGTYDDPLNPINSPAPVKNRSLAKKPNVKKTILPEFEDNILNYYPNYTYHIRFFVCHEKANHDNVSQFPQVIIAESGLTGTGIEDLKFSATVAPRSANLNSLATQFEFTLVEPFAQSFYEMVDSAVKNVGGKDRQSSPYWIEISFKGYNEDGSLAGNGIDGNIQSIIHRERIQIGSVETSIDASGARHKILAVPFNEVGLQDKATRINRAITISASTMKEFIDSLKVALNFSEPNKDRLASEKQQSPKSEASYLQHVVYNIKFSSELESLDIGNWKLRGDNKTGNKTSAATTSGNEIKWLSTKNQNDSFLSWIMEALSTTDYAQRLGIYGQSESPDPEEAGCDGTEKNPLDPAKTFFIDSDVEIVGYDSTIRQYKYLITYYIRMYESFLPFVSASEVKKAQEMEKKRLEQIVTVRSLKKRYDFQYTGLNTEVLDFKIETDNAWAYVLPEFQGKSKIEVSDTAGSSNLQQPRKQIATANVDNLSMTGKQNTGECKVDDKMIEKIQTPENNKDLEDNTLADSIEILENGIKVTPTPNLLTRLDEINQNIQNLQSTLIQDFYKINTDYSQALTQSRYSGARLKSSTRENERGNFNNVIIAEELNLTLNDSRRIKIDVDKVTDHGNTYENTSGKGRTFLNTVLNQIYGINGTMVDLDMTIRGDPYWFGEPSVPKRIDDTTSALNYISGDTIILVHTGFAIPYDDNNGSKSSDKGTGLALQNNRTRDTNGLNALYTIYEVEHIFSGGKFTQRLSGYMDPITSDQAARDLIRGAINE